MGKVVVTLRIMAKGVETDLDKLTEEIIKVLKNYAEGEAGFKKVPIAFGLVSLEVMFMMPEAEGGTDPAEKAIAELEGVSGVNVLGVTLV